MKNTNVPYDQILTDLKDAMFEQAVNNIIELDSDRVEQVIVDNADILQDYWYKFNEKSKKCAMGEEETLYAELGQKVDELMNRKIDELAEEDCDKAVS